MVLGEGTRKKLDRVICEHKAVRAIRDRGLPPRRKLLLIGKPGTGKTLTAAALAGELRLPLFVVRLDALITKFMGETAAKLRLIFEALSQTRGIYFSTSSIASGRPAALAIMSASAPHCEQLPSNGRTGPAPVIAARFGCGLRLTRLAPSGHEADGHLFFLLY
jgi:hypothetical protein